MRKYLLPENGNFYKANLHCHTTVSDGKMTPEEIKTRYMENGYSIVAYTDHNSMVAHPELKDENFLPLVGYEYDVSEHNHEISGDNKCCHICFIAPDDEKIPPQVCYNREKYIWGNAATYRDILITDKNEEDFERVYTPECVNEIVRRHKKFGFFASYNHPSWSREDYRDYMAYEGFDAMEIVNYGCIAEGYNDYADREYDDMLRGGKHIYCIATDDNHSAVPVGEPHCQTCGGWVMIKADKLEYKTVFDALEKGNFYSSMGPSIKELYIEDGILHIETSDVKYIALYAGTRRGGIVFAKDGEFVNSADFKVRDIDHWVRIDIIDANGKHANTNAFFVEDIL